MDPLSAYFALQSEKKLNDAFDEAVKPVEPKTAFIESVKYNLFERPYRSAQFHRIQKAVESGWLKAQDQALHAASQGTVVNPSFLTFGAYSQLAGVLEPISATRVTFDKLTELCEGVPVISCIIGKRVEQVAEYAHIRHSHIGRSKEAGFHVCMSDSREKATSEDKKQMHDLEMMIENTGFCEPPSDETPIGYEPTFEYFLRTATRDLLTYDWVAIRRWKSAIDPDTYPVVAFTPIDASRIRRLQRKFIDVVENKIVTEEPERERKSSTPGQEIALVKIDDDSSVRIEEFTPDEVVVGCRRPRTSDSIYGYGYPEGEEIMNVGTSWIAALTHNSSRFSSNSLPRGFMTVLGNASEAQQQAFALNFKEMMSGSPWKIPIFQAPAQQGTAVNWTPIDMSPKDMEFSNFMWMLSSICHAAFHISTSETGWGDQNPFKPALSEASPEANLKYSMDTGLRPLLRWWEMFINRHIVWKLFPTRRYRLEFSGLGDWDEMQDTEMRQARMAAGLTTPVMEWNDLDIDMPEEIRNHPAANFPAPFVQGYQILSGQQQAEQQQNAQQESIAQQLDLQKQKLAGSPTPGAGKSENQGSDNDNAHAQNERIEEQQGQTHA
jgi:hypothetical protein